MPTDLEQQLPRFAEALDREAPAISVDEILSRGTVAVDVDRGWSGQRGTRSRASRPCPGATRCPTTARANTRRRSSSCPRSPPNRRPVAVSR